VLVTVGLCLSWGVTALGMRYLAGWEWMSALFFGALIAATDPVSVIATLKEARVRGRLRLLIEAESLFNDGTAAVVFGVVVIAATGSTLSVSGVAKTLVVSVGGGILCGGLMAGALLLLAGRTEDHLVPSRRIHKIHNRSPSRITSVSIPFRNPLMRLTLFGGINSIRSP